MDQNFYVYTSGFTQGQEKSGNEGTWIKVKKFEKKTDIVSLTLQNSLFSKAFKW